MIGDIPQISGSTYTGTAYGLAQLAGMPGLAAGQQQLGGLGNVMGGLANQICAQNALHRPAAMAQRDIEVIKAMAGPVKPNPAPAKENTMTHRRLIQVLIADPDENVPLDKCLLYKGEPKLTDSTDQELFFEVDIKSLLDTHNAARTKIVDKSVKERTEYLEPAKIRELKMVVVTIATF